MHFPTFIRIVLFFLAAITVSTPLPNESADHRIKTIYQFPNETWVENIAVRANGNLLVTLINQPEVWEVDPRWHTAKLIYHFPNATVAAGISEVSPDVFTVAVGNWSDVTFATTVGSWSAWRVDLRNHRNTADAVTKITDIPEAGFLNGLVALPTQRNIVLIGDSNHGVVYSLNVTSGTYHVALDEPEFKPNASVPVKLGLNGIRIHNQHLYFANSFSSPIFARIPIHADGTAAGAVEDLLVDADFPTNESYTVDDFTIDPHTGVVWLNTDPSNTLLKFTPPRNLTIVAGGVNDSTLAGDTSSAFGRTARDRKTLYVVTNGGIASPPPGGIVGGKVLALDTNGL